MSLAELHRLQAAWEAEYPQQARGGDVAMAGFAFQFLAVLLASVRDWRAREPANRGEPGVYGELLSDIAQARADGVIVVTQVKYTQSSGMVISALADLFRVYRVAATRGPELLERLDLRVLSARPKLESVANTIARWQPEGVAPDDPQLADFRARVKAEIDPSPEDELLALLANELRAEQPLVTVRGWLGKLVEAAGLGKGYAAVAKDIWGDLAALERARAQQKARSVYVWTAADQPPARVVPGPVLIGQQPQVHHLREGFFAPRHDLFDAIADRVANWISASHAQTDESLRLPLYWLGGRSGAGKSIALLHVLASLHERDTIVLFPPSVSHLPETLRWSRDVHRPGRPIVIALDDPHTPAAQGEAAALWRNALDELHEIRQAGDASTMPFLVCCGPTEQAERLRDDLPDDVALLIDELPREMSADLTVLRRWYHARTGNEPPPVGDENVLLVQLFFEWRVGEPLRAFADRFRKRINAADRTGAIEKALARMLALNRLYAGACRQALEADLSPALRDVLDRLRDENHLADDSSHTRPGLWLAHPHLAEAIYASWFPASSPNARRDHLTTAIFGALHHGATPSEQTAPLWAIARALGPGAAGTDVAHRLDERTARKVLEDVYAHAVRGRSMPLAHLPVWIQLRRRATDLVLKPDPVEVAIARLGGAGVEETGLRLTCHKLLEHLVGFSDDARERALAAIFALLARAPDWREWAAVANDAISRTRDPRLWPLVAEWVERRTRWRSAQQLLVRALHHSGGEPNLTRIAHAKLAEASATNEWSRIAVLVMTTSDEARNDVLEWIETRRMEPEVAFLLGALLKQGTEESEMWALAWARRWHLEAMASHVLQPLCDVAEPKSEVLAWSRAWIEKRHDNSGFLMEKLIVLAPGDQALRALAGRWLDWTAASDAQWAFVWLALWRHTAKDEQLAGFATRWLMATPADHGSWSFVWRALWEHENGGEALAALARDWLSKAPPELLSWRYVWEALWQHEKRDETLTGLARDWLSRAHPEHRSWGFVWQASWQHENGDEALATLARDWLSKVPPEHASWSSVWKALWKHKKGDKVLVALARDWLSRAHPEHASWEHIWEILWKRKREEALAALARDWLSKTPPEHASWQHVWKPLWLHKIGDDELAALARDWLSKAPPEHASWKHVWKPLWRHKNYDDDDLAALARDWLSKAPSEHRSWGFVWLVLWQHKYGEDKLAAIACDWLSKAPAEHQSWGLVWRPLWHHKRGDEVLTMLARDWLSKAAFGHRSWGLVWPGLWQHKMGDEALAALGRDWLSKAPPEHQSWGLVWKPLWRHKNGDDEIAALARDWLPKAPPGHVSWRYVWEALWQHKKGDEALAALARDWLSKASPEHGPWKYIWEALWQHKKGDEVLEALAYDWLSKASPEHGPWKYVWEALWQHKKGDEALDALARDWLSKAPTHYPSRKYVQRVLQGDAEADKALVLPDRGPIGES